MRENNWKTNGFLDGYRRQAKFEMINFSQKADIFDKIHPGFLMSNLSKVFNQSLVPRYKNNFLFYVRGLLL